jgi:hypothetical protein
LEPDSLRVQYERPAPGVAWKKKCRQPCNGIQLAATCLNADQQLLPHHAGSFLGAAGLGATTKNGEIMTSAGRLYVFANLADAKY